ncbi:unnamed protein product, partial [Iphiclides podalirius]
MTGAPLELGVAAGHVPHFALMITPIARIHVIWRSAIGAQPEAPRRSAAVPSRRPASLAALPWPKRGASTIFRLIKPTRWRDKRAVNTRLSTVESALPQLKTTRWALYSPGQTAPTNKEEPERVLEVSVLMAGRGGRGGEDNAPPGRFCCRGFPARDICPNCYNNSPKKRAATLSESAAELHFYTLQRPYNVKCIGWDVFIGVIVVGDVSFIRRRIREPVAPVVLALRATVSQYYKRR